MYTINYLYIGCYVTQTTVCRAEFSFKLSSMVQLEGSFEDCFRTSHARREEGCGWHIMSQKPMCAYTTNEKSAWFLVLMFINWHSKWASRIAARRVLKKHLHLHPYKIISAHELRERANIKCAEYFRDVITVNGEDIMDVRSFHQWGVISFIWLLLTAKTNAFSQWLICMSKDTPLHDQKFGVWCATSWN
jgi:hypothetical protein